MKTQKPLMLALVAVGVIGLPLMVGTFVMDFAKFQQTCQPGNPDYENSTGICKGRGKKERGFPSASDLETKIGIPCKRLARQMMRDPDSFEAIAINPYNSTADGKPVNGVVVQYRARNGFGGYGGGSVTCESPTGRMEDTLVVSHSEQ